MHPFFFIIRQIFFSFLLIFYFSFFLIYHFQNIVHLKKERAMIRSFAVLISVIVLLAGCVAVETVTGRDFDSSKVPQIQIGKTTQSEILQMFGEPDSRGLVSGNIAWRYYYQRTSSTGSLSPQEQQIKPHITEKTLNIIFKNGVVERYDFFEK